MSQESTNLILSASRGNRDALGGLDVKETAQVMNVSEATVKNDWRFARAWLASQLASEKGGT